MDDIFYIVQPRLGLSHKQCKQALYGSTSYSDVHLTKICSVLLIRRLPKMPSSSSTSTGSQIAIWRRPLTWTEQRRDFSCDLLPSRRERCSSDHRRFFSEPGSARYSSTPPLTTVWSNYQTLFNDFFEVYITKMVTLSANVQTDFWPV